jgi:putative sugar O-methyltransferase
MLYFRGHNAYLYQDGRFNRNVIGYLLSYYYIKSIDKYQLLERLLEDNSFGAITYLIDGKLVSRDLLDSIREIYFLDSHLNLIDRSKFSVLDIGAGYGRLAYRMVEAFPNLESYLCTDAIAVSTFVAEYYLKFRKTENRTKILPLDTVSDDLKDYKVDLAVNIHSFSECSLKAIDWWMNILAQNKIPYLLIVPNSKDDLLTQNRESFSYLVEEAGYKLISRGPRYDDPMLQKYALNPDYFHLYKYKG